jgi:hypothetical protein
MTGNDPKGKAKGGFARALALSPDERSEIARRAAEARWEGVVPKATHSGVLKIGDAEIQAFVLDNGERVLSTRGIMKALKRTWRGRKYSGTELPVFLEANNLKPFIPNDSESVLKPVRFEVNTGASLGEGYRAELLHFVCDTYLAARAAGGLRPSQIDVAAQCEILLRALSKVGIVALVDEATGYQAVRPQHALQAYLEKIIRKELAAWAKKFPDEFYENIYKLKGWPWPGMQKNRYSVVAHYTRDLVYERIAPGLLQELEDKSPPNERGQRPNKLHQWLTEDVGNPMLAQHLHSLIMFQRLALSQGFGWHRFLNMVDRVLPKRENTLELPFPEAELEPIPS